MIEAEIRRRVRMPDGRLVSARAVAAAILQEYPGCAEEAELADRVMMAAGDAGVPVEIGGS